MLALLALACTSKDNPGVDSGQDSAETAPDSYPSSYTDGKYRASAFSLLTEEGEGLDLDGDGVVDNKLPLVLTLVNAFVEADIHPDTLNANIDEQLASGELVLLSQGAYSDGALRFDILLGAEGEAGLSVDPSSYDGDGQARSHFEGVFLDETQVGLNADSVRLPFPLIEGEPVVLIPLVQARIEGTLSPELAEGVLGGAVPVDALVDEVIQQIVPTGEDYDEDVYKMPRDEFIEWVRETGNGENVSDVVLEDGSRAVSAAVGFRCEPAEF